MENEIEEVQEAPEEIRFENGLRVRARRITGNPVLRNMRVLRRFPNRFEVHLPEHKANTVIVVPRAPGQNARQAVQAYLASPVGQ
jgi:hypothetical protein